MNMMYSDYCQVAKRQSVDTPGFYADMAKAFLEDADAADGKAHISTGIALLISKTEPPV